MNQRTLGAAGPDVTAIGLGCMGMSAGYGERDDAESTRTVHRALDLGINHLDTADMYGVGHNEELVGAWSRSPATRSCWRRSSATDRLLRAVRIRRSTPRRHGYARRATRRCAGSA